MPDKYVLDLDGQPLPCDDLLVWAQWFEQHDRTLAKDLVAGVGISTVFLGLDHNFCGGPPVLWESLVFGGPLDGEQRRYQSREEALAGHTELVAAVTAALAAARP